MDTNIRSLLIAAQKCTGKETFDFILKFGFIYSYPMWLVSDEITRFWHLSNYVCIPVMVHISLMTISYFHFLYYQS